MSLTSLLSLLGVLLGLFGLLYFYRRRTRQPLVVRTPVHVRTEFIGFEVLNIKAGMSGKLAVGPCLLMRITRLVIASSVAPHVVINQIMVNGKVQLINCGPVPGEMFLLEAVDTLTIDTLQPGCTLEVTVSNVSKEDVTFRMGGVARVIDDGFYKSDEAKALASTEEKSLDIPSDPILPVVKEKTP